MNPRRATAVSGLVSGVLLVSCSEPPGDAIGQGQFPTIYGAVDIYEPFAYADVTWAARAADFSVAVFDASALDETNPNDIRQRASWTVTSRLQATTGSPLCAGEPFETQPALAACSGVLIAEDLVLTAGHCTNGCGDVRFVFDYALTPAGTLPALTQDDVYRCDTTVAEHDSATGLDYAILHLTRPVADRQPAPIRASSDPLTPGTELVMAGYPWRMPLKIADNAAVRSAADFVSEETCYSWNRCADDGCRGEDVMYVHHALEHACMQIEAPFCDP
jgi:hypothetical protein